MVRIASIAALVCFTVAAPGWCEGATSPRDKTNNKFFAMVGEFVPVESGFDGRAALAITYSWAHASRYATVEYTRSTSTQTIQAQQLGVTDQAFTAIAGVRQWQGKWYYGGGAGISTLRRDIPGAYGTVASSDTHFAWELLVGAPFGGRGLAEVKYIDAGAGAARGFAAFVGVTY